MNEKDFTKISEKLGVVEDLTEDIDSFIDAQIGTATEVLSADAVPSEVIKDIKDELVHLKHIKSDFDTVRSTIINATENANNVFSIMSKSMMIDGVDADSKVIDSYSNLLKSITSSMKTLTETYKDVLEAHEKINKILAPTAGKTESSAPGTVNNILITTTKDLFKDIEESEQITKD